MVRLASTSNGQSREKSKKMVSMEPLKMTSYLVYQAFQKLPKAWRPKKEGLGTRLTTALGSKCKIFCNNFRPVNQSDFLLRYVASSVDAACTWYQQQHGTYTLVPRLLFENYSKWVERETIPCYSTQLSKCSSQFSP